MSQECTIILQGVFGEGNRHDMKSGDTNKMVYILLKIMYIYAKTLLIEQYENVIFV